MNKVMPDQSRRIGNRRVATIQDAELHQLVFCNVLNEFRANLFQRWATLGEVVLEDPLTERFTGNRHRISDAEFIGNHRAFAVRGRWRDAVDHRVREGNVCTDPIRKVRVRQTSQTNDRAFCDVTVFRQVIAGHKRERRKARIAPNAERFDHHTEHGFRRVWVRSICDNVGVFGVKTIGQGVDVVAALGDGGRYDLDRGIGHFCDGDLGIDLNEVNHRTNDLSGQARWVQFDNGCQPVLFRKTVAHGCVACADASATQRPVVAFTQCKQAVEIYRHVRAMEVANPHVEDARRQRGSVVRRGADGIRELSQSGGVEFDCHGHAIQFPPSTPKHCATT